MGQKSLNIAAIKQTSPATCWAACLCMLANHFQVAIEHDQEALARDYFGEGAHEKCQNIELAIAKAELDGAQEGASALPRFAKITAIIDSNRPMVGCLSKRPVQMNRNITGGHYVLLTGYDDEGKQLEVIDPCSGAKGYIAYNDGNVTVSINKVTMYWSMTLYVDKR